MADKQQRRAKCLAFAQQQSEKITPGVRIQGWADGEFIVATPMANAFDDVVGTDGEVARSKNNDRRWKVVLKLLQTAQSNAFLSTILNTDQLAPNGAGVGTFSWQDLQGGSLLQSSQAWIAKWPDASQDRTAKTREWEIHMSDALRVEGGN